MKFLPIQRKVEGNNWRPWELKFKVIAHAELDDEDQPWATTWCWSLSKDGYPRRHEYANGKTITIYLHNEIARRMGLTWTYPNTIDHYPDRNPLNCQRSNLRVATRSEQQINQGLSRDSTSGAKGVCWRGLRQKWQARIMLQGKRVDLGLFNSKADALAACQKAAERRGHDIEHEKWVVRMEAEWGEPG